MSFIFFTLITYINVGNLYAFASSEIKTIKIQEENSSTDEGMTILTWSSSNYQVITVGEKSFVILIGQFNVPVKSANANNKPLTIPQDGSFKLMMNVSPERNNNFSISAIDSNNQMHQMHYSAFYEKTEKESLLLKRKKFSKSPQYWIFQNSIGALFTTWNGTDANSGAVAQFISQYHYFLQSKIIKKINTKIQVYALGNMHMIQFIPAASKTITSDFLLPAGFGLGINYTFNNRIKTNLTFNYQQQYYLKSTSTNTVSFETKGAPAGEFSLNWKMIPIKDAWIVLEGSYDYLMGATGNGYKISAGSNWGGKIYYLNLSEFNEFRAGVSFNESKQNTSIIQQSITNWGVELGYDFSFL